MTTSIKNSPRDQTHKTYASSSINQVNIPFYLQAFLLSFNYFWTRLPLSKTSFQLRTPLPNTLLPTVLWILNYFFFFFSFSILIFITDPFKNQQKLRNKHAPPKFLRSNHTTKIGIFNERILEEMASISSENRALRSRTF